MQNSLVLFLLLAEFLFTSCKWQTQRDLLCHRCCASALLELAAGFGAPVVWERAACISPRDGCGFRAGGMGQTFVSLQDAWVSFMQNSFSRLLQSQVSCGKGKRCKEFLCGFKDTKLNLWNSFPRSDCLVKFCSSSSVRVEILTGSVLLEEKFGLSVSCLVSQGLVHALPNVLFHQLKESL